MGKPKILVYDIETCPMIVSTFDLFPRKPIPYQGIKQLSYILCASWKWLGEKKVYAAQVDPGPNPGDKGVVAALAGVIDSSDAVVAHYGDEFDIKVLRARLAYHGLDPTFPTKQIDTYKIAKSKLKLPSYRLDFLGEYFGVGRKIVTPGGLWEKCLEGDAKALKKMVEYNKGDVELLESVYLKLAPFAGDSAKPFPNKVDSAKDPCPSCNVVALKHEKYKKISGGFRAQYQCKECGSWCSNRHMVKEIA